MILVVGATGLLGQEVCRQLAQAGKPVRALVRTTTPRAKVENLTGLGIATTPGDLRDAASLRAACEDVDAVICTASSMPFSYQAGSNDLATVDRDGVCHLVDAAREAGVRHFVHTTFSGNFDRPSPLHDAKREAERHVSASGMTFTILRPSCFMEVWFTPAAGFDVAGRHAIIYGTGDRHLSWIAVHDVARFAVASLSNSAAHNATLELGGPDPLTPREVVALFERATKQRFRVTEVPESVLDARYAAASDPMDKSFAALMIGVSRGDWIPMAGLLQKFPFTLTHVQDYAATTVGAQPAKS